MVLFMAMVQGLFRSLGQLQIADATKALHEYMYCHTIDVLSALLLLQRLLAVVWQVRLHVCFGRSVISHDRERFDVDCRFIRSPCLP